MVRTICKLPRGTDTAASTSEAAERLIFGGKLFHVVRFNLNKLNEVEGKEQYRAEISNRFAALEIFDAEVDINRAWGNIKQPAKEILGYHELTQQKPWFNQGCSKLLHH
jgi:hypothetical protein